jgi:lysophospholipase L1-like esterase
MLECLILGDSIAVGTQQFAKECQLVGKGGINTWQWNQMYPTVDLTAGVVIISLATNDHKYIKTVAELEKMRQRVKSGRVFWVLPAGNLKGSEVPIETIQSYVRTVAERYGDVVLPIRGLQADGIHPSWSGYRDIVERTKSQ